MIRRVTCAVLIVVCVFLGMAGASIGSGVLVAIAFILGLVALVGIG